MIGKRNQHTIDKGDVEVHPSEYTFEYTSEYVPYPEITPNKSIDDGETDQILEFFLSEHDDDLLYVDLQIIQELLVVATSLEYI